MDDLLRVWRGNGGSIGARDDLSCAEKLSAARQCGDFGDNLDFGVRLHIIVGIGKWRLPGADSVERKDGVSFFDSRVYVWLLLRPNLYIPGSASQPMSVFERERILQGNLRLIGQRTFCPIHLNALQSAICWTFPSSLLGCKAQYWCYRFWQRSKARWPHQKSGSIYWSPVPIGPHRYRCRHGECCSVGWWRQQGSTAQIGHIVW